MSISPLSSPPLPPNSNNSRAMFLWGDSTFLDTDAHGQSVVNFCGTVGCNVVFMDIWGYLGGGNWSNHNVVRMKQLVQALHSSSIQVYAMAGNNDWGHNQAWVMNNVIRPVEQFNAVAGQGSLACDGFDGIMLDVEYWTLANYTSSVELPGLCDLMQAVKARTGLRVGCFATQWLALTGSGANLVTYQGKTQEEGKFLVDNADLVVVACYSNNGGGTTGATQITEFQPWFNYASQSGQVKLLYCGSETSGPSGGTTYFGESKATMEQNHTAISNQFSTGSNATFLGQCVDPYSGWSAMS